LDRERKSESNFVFRRIIKSKIIFNFKSKSMSELLTLLFDSKPRARLIKFFIQNDNQEYTLADICVKNKLPKNEVVKEINRFEKMKMIIAKARKGKRYYQTNLDFIFYPELKMLVAKSNTLPASKGLLKINSLGKVKLALISGVFLNNPKSRTDLLIVGDELSKAKIKHLLEMLEAEIGREINYSILSSEEFRYRVNMLDKFIMEFLEGPYEEVINKIPNLKQITRLRKK